MIADQEKAKTFETQRSGGSRGKAYIGSKSKTLPQIHADGRGSEGIAKSQELPGENSLLEQFRTIEYRILRHALHSLRRFGRLRMTVGGCFFRVEHYERFTHSSLASTGGDAFKWMSADQEKTKTFETQRSGGSRAGLRFKSFPAVAPNHLPRHLHPIPLSCKPFHLHHSRFESSARPECLSMVFKPSWSQR